MVVVVGSPVGPLQEGHPWPTGMQNKRSYHKLSASVWVENFSITKEHTVMGNTFILLLSIMWGAPAVKLKLLVSELPQCSWVQWQSLEGLILEQHVGWQCCRFLFMFCHVKRRMLHLHLVGDGVRRKRQMSVVFNEVMYLKWKRNDSISQTQNWVRQADRKLTWDQMLLNQWIQESQRK